MKLFADFAGNNSTGGSPFYNEDFFTVCTQLLRGIDGSITDAKGDFLLDGAVITPNGSNYDMTDAFVYVDGEIRFLPAQTAITPGVKYIIPDTDVVTNRTQGSGSSEPFFVQKTATISTSRPVSGGYICFAPEFNNIFNKSDAEISGGSDIGLEIIKGESLSFTRAAIAILSPYSVAAIVGSSLRKYSYNENGELELIGSGITLGGGTQAICAHGENRISLIDQDDELTMYDHNGSIFVKVGNELSIGGTTLPSLAALSDSTVSFFDGGNLDLRKYSFNGTNWTQVGNDTNLAGAGQCRMAALADDQIVIASVSLNWIRKYVFDGSDWNISGSSFSRTIGANGDLASIDPERAFFFDGTAFSIIDFDGSVWNETTFSEGELAGISPNSYMSAIDSGSAMLADDLYGIHIVKIKNDKFSNSRPF